MTTTALAEIAQLGLSERIQLVSDIWDTIVVAPDDLSLSREQGEELERRLQACRWNSQPVSSW